MGRLLGAKLYRVTDLSLRYAGAAIFCACTAVLTAKAYSFQNAHGINYSLRVLYTLLAQGRISPRRASVLAYISNLLLRTLPAIDNDPYPHAGVRGFNAKGERVSPAEPDSTADSTDSEGPAKSQKPN